MPFQAVILAWSNEAWCPIFTVNRTLDTPSGNVIPSNDGIPDGRKLSDNSPVLKPSSLSVRPDPAWKQGICQILTPQTPPGLPDLKKHKLWLTAQTRVSCLWTVASVVPPVMVSCDGGCSTHCCFQPQIPITIAFLSQQFLLIYSCQNEIRFSILALKRSNKTLTTAQVWREKM